ncbi:hypothetical protein PMPD1_0717 [Paramixta manurensis]|uniref:Uncharacterized protein n=1 Tax=Paramixta manurensis TaxID=2740817 RepID=A0A6M8U7T6_9GAMM|nr:hypothetical protein PMPD1_0717 [Erwiniaceae bacterium PD-1]
MAHANDTQKNENAVIASVKNSVEQRNWIANPDCTDYLLTKNSDPSIDRVDVMEKHGGKCGLDAQVQHRLFSVFVDQKTHQMASDKDDPENGTLTVLPSQ